MCLFPILGHLKPKSLLEDGLNKVTIVSLAYVDFEGVLVFTDVQLAIDCIGKIDHKEKLTKFVDLMIDGVIRHVL